MEVFTLVAWEPIIEQNLPQTTFGGSFQELPYNPVDFYLLPQVS